MRHSTLHLVAILPAALLSPAAASSQSAAVDTQAVIANARSAAPAAIANGATILDAQQKVLRTGTNGYTCMPDLATVPNNSPMCLDATWMQVLEGLIAKRPPKIDRVGIGYMLQDDQPVSNTDPFATAPTPDNEWIQNPGPHLMIVFPDPSVLAKLPSDPKPGTPYVMWRGTPYAHLMVPAVAAPKK